MSNNSPSIPLTQLRLIEIDKFAIEFLSSIAGRESWRKEIYRPIYHIHKWWAMRLGSIFRGILLGCLLPADAILENQFYQKHNFCNISVLDPFMGSGTTVGEAHKLGCIAIGRDINPVACESVRVALGSLDPFKLKTTFHALTNSVGERIKSLYKSKNKDGKFCDVLYFFWVKVLPCPHCFSKVDLFSSRIIAKNAYPNRKPLVQICCPGCGELFPALNHQKETQCPFCLLNFDPHTGPIQGKIAVCPTCQHKFSVLEAVRKQDHPPEHRLYGKLILTEDGEKHYCTATEYDLHVYKNASILLTEEIKKGNIRLPRLTLTNGYNTRQAITYNYRSWRDFFNHRQLLALGWLQDEISRISDQSTRDIFLTLFSGTLEFNNMFASYKGEGTGAVRHMFSNHILKPERTPIEANVWGTSKSSGSFSNLFKTRMTRLIDYRIKPFEVNTEESGKSACASASFSGIVDISLPNEKNWRSRGIYLSCNSSDRTDLPDESVDYIVTDPPFFDNVHYSELADFFYAWQCLYPRGFIKETSTTRNISEVQDTDAERFAKKLMAVFKECHRLLKKNGLMVFSYHHSRPGGWFSLVKAIFDADFSIINAHPVKAEMSVAAPKMQAKDPIQLDVVLVCQKRFYDSRQILLPDTAFNEALERTREKLERLISSGLTLSKNDRRISLIGQFLSTIGPVASSDKVIHYLESLQGEIENVIIQLPYILKTAKEEIITQTPSLSQQRVFNF